MTRAAALLPGVDRAAFAVSLASRLRARGVTTGLTATEDFVTALGVVRVSNRSQLYWTARVCLIRRQSDLAVFDAVFAAVFDDALLPLDPNARRKPLDYPPPAGGDTQMPVPKGSDETQDGAGLPWVTRPPVVDLADDSDSALVVHERLPDHLAALADVPFEDLSPAELQQLGQWLAASVRSWPTRRTRRMAIDRAGHRIALRATIARSRRTGWEAVDLVCSKPVDQPRRVVMLCDVSQSMQAQALAYFQLMRALALTTDAEVFAFATSLTRLTTVLAHRCPAAAIEQANTKVVDRFGGTRIASNVQALLSSHHGGTLRGAVVIIASDGWDSDRPEQLSVAMARLWRRAYRVIWINPRAAAPGYEPRVAAMAAALPYCDELLPANTFASLARVIAEVSLSSTGSRGSRAGTGRR